MTSPPRPLPGRGEPLLDVVGEPAVLRDHPWVRRATFCAALVAALVAGRLLQSPGAHLAVFWPAAAVGLLWVAGSRGTRARVVDTAFVATCTAGVRLAAGTGGDATALLAAAGCVEALVGAWTYRLLQPSGMRLARPGHLRTLVLASLAGALVSAPLAAVAFSLDSGAEPLVTAGQWVLRTLVSAFVVLAVVLRVGEWRLAGSPTALPMPVGEGLALAASGVVTYGLGFWLQPDLSVEFLVLPVAVWVALRSSTTVATLHVVTAAAVVVLTTWSGTGPWRELPPTTQALVSLAFTGTLGVVTLLLGLYRDESAAQARRADEALADAADQTALLGAVFTSISDAVSVVAADGTCLLRNPAAVELLGPVDPAEQHGWQDTFEVLDEAGRPVPTDRLPLFRALRGEDVHGHDLVLAATDGSGHRVVNTSAHPLRGVRGRFVGGVVNAFHDVTDVRASAAEVARGRDLFAAVLDGAAEHAVVAVDLDGRITVFNEGAQRMLGWSPEEILGQSAGVLHDADELTALAVSHGLREPRDLYGFVAAAAGPQTYRLSYVREDGSHVPVSITLSAMRDQDHEVHGYLGVATDLTDQLAAERDLAESEALFRAAFETAPTGIVVVAAEGEHAGRVVQVNPATERITGRPAEELVGSVFADLAADEAAADVAVAFAPLLLGEDDTAALDLPVAQPDGTARELEVSATRTSARGHGAVLLCLLEDVTVRRDAERQLTHQALHDALTGLPNRTLFVDRLDHARSAVLRAGGEVGVLYLDLDGFKAVNDTAGHAAGDELLRRVADAFQAAVRPGDTVARLGGDEFAVICPQTGGEDLVGVAERLLATLRDPFPLGGHEAVVGASVGVRGDDGTGTTDQVLRDADAAMYRAKRAGKGRVVVHGGHDAPRPQVAASGAGVPAGG